MFDIDKVLTDGGVDSHNKLDKDQFQKAIEQVKFSLKGAELLKHVIAYDELVSVNSEQIPLDRIWFLTGRNIKDHYTCTIQLLEDIIQSIGGDEHVMRRLCQQVYFNDDNYQSFNKAKYYEKKCLMICEIMSKFPTAEAGIYFEDDPELIEYLIPEVPQNVEVIHFLG